MNTPPATPIQAVTHADPYPYYARLASERPLYFDETLNMWVASSSQAVQAVLHSPLCRVRPVGEPVPQTLIGSTAGTIFAHLVRQNDGVKHCPFKRSIVATLNSADPKDIRDRSRFWAQSLREMKLPAQRFIFQLPLYVMADLLGVAQTELAQTTAEAAAFVACLSPSSTPAQIERGKAPAETLFWQFEQLLTKSTSGLLGQLASYSSEEQSMTTIIANAIGFLTQSYDATAGLIGNTVVALARQNKRIFSHEQVREAVATVMRDDPPIQNTRRYLAEDGLIAGMPMRAGQAVLVVLAAASRDPQRQLPGIIGFGDGAHACPGQLPAQIIAEEGVAQLIAAGVQLSEPLAYQPSVNARIALLS